MASKITLDQFVSKSIAIHGNTYDYSKTEYINNNLKLIIICKLHGEFLQLARNHMLGRGCHSCKALNAIERLQDTTQSFIEKAKAVHGDTYDYSKALYNKSNGRVEIICYVHGSFFQIANAHISKGAGCPKCAGKNTTPQEFIDQLTKIHGARYIYTNTVYNGIKNKITIDCKIHGSFQQTAEGHRIGKGCSQCWAESYSSIAEKELADWIESCGIEIQRNDRTILDKFEIDILIKSANIGIEFNGRYWHSDKVRKNIRFHEVKTEGAKRAGIRLISIWDFDWENKKTIVKDMLLMALGKSTKQKIHARNCQIIEINNKKSSQFYEEHHIQGACRGGMFNIALYHNDNIVACMTFTKGATRRGRNEDWELARYASSEIVRGGASKLFSYFLTNKNPKTVWSFSDKQTFSGNLYNILGFISDGEIKSDYRVAHPRTTKTWHKSLWQRKNIQKRIIELGSNEKYNYLTDPRTEKQMQDLLGVLRVWDSGKIRWIWNNHSIV